MTKDSYGEEILFENEAIRDTLDHVSLKAQVASYVPKNVSVINKLNEAVDITVFGARKGNADHFPINAVPVTVAANSNKHIPLTDYFPVVLIHAICPVAPVSGELTAVLLKVA